MIHRIEFEDLVRAALREDAPFGDPFGASFPGPGTGRFLAVAGGVLCGGPVAREVFRQVDPGVSLALSADGARVAPGEPVGEASGTVELSLDLATPARDHYEMGRALAGLRERGVLVLGSGNIVHNLRAIDWNMREGGYSWAAEFDAAVVGALAVRDHDALCEYTNNDYHSPSDEVKPDWDLAGAAEDGKLFFAMGYRIANADKFPEWKPGNEFKAIRDKALATGK